jgi:hypothetical protein
MLELSEHPDVISGEVVDEDVEVTTVPYWVDTYPIMLDVMAKHANAKPYEVANVLDELGVEMPGASDGAIVGAFLDGFVTA